MRLLNLFSWVSLSIALVSGPTAFAANGGGLALAGSLALAGGSQVTGASGSPQLAPALELGAHLQGRRYFVGLFGDRFTSEVWQAGITARQFMGSGNRYWVQVKVALSGVAGMIGSQAEVKSWDNYLNGGVAAGMRIPMGAALHLQPFVGFDSFIPIIDAQRVYTGPNESSLRFVTGARCNIPMAGIRLALEL